MPVDRNEAVTYLKEVLALCGNMLPETVSFEKLDNSDSVGYQVRIKGSIYESDRQMVREIAKKYILTLKEDTDSIIVYTSKLHA
jgi:threonine dehydratase